MIFICYEKCSTCKKAKKWLDSNNIEYNQRDIKTNNPNYNEIKKWHQASGLPIKKFFNTSGMLYRSMQLKDKLPEMSTDEKYKLLSTDGMLVKRPILIDEGFVKVGFRLSDWEDIL